ncbi:MAG: FAD-binding oxidoreductase [bacterium]
MSSESINSAFPDLWVEQAAYPALMPRSSEDVMGVVQWCRDHGMRIFPVGSGHSLGEKFAVPNGVVSMISLARDGVSEPDTHDLAIEVEAGVPAVLLHQLVHDAGLRLDGWPESYPGTVGGLFAGARGLELRHLVLGMDIIDGRGRSLRFGGRVRKNVSGFDVPGVMIGSRGMLGWIDRLYLKLNPGGSPLLDRRVPTPLGQITSPKGLYQRVAVSLDPDGVFLKPGE